MLEKLFRLLFGKKKAEEQQKDRVYVVKDLVFNEPFKVWTHWQRFKQVEMPPGVYKCISWDGKPKQGPTTYRYAYGEWWVDIDENLPGSQ